MTTSYTVDTKHGSKTVDSPFETDASAAAFLSRVQMAGTFAEDLCKAMRQYGSLRTAKQRAWLHVLATERMADHPDLVAEFFPDEEKSEGAQAAAAPDVGDGDVPF